ncbi:MAG: winged helix-turn-helix transcriptional regulator [Candidatus Thorarchaeota archaeon]
MSRFDSMDTSILRELEKNCRISYQALGVKFGVSANAIKRRINNLIDSGIIEKFIVTISHAMADTELLIAYVVTSGSIPDDEFVDLVGKNNMVVRAGFDSSRACILMVEYKGATGLAEIGSFLRGIESVESVELHPIPTEQGDRIDLSTLHLRVLRVLVEDPRMSIVEMSKRSGLSTKRIRRVIQEMMESSAVQFKVITNLNEGESTHFSIRTTWDERKINAEDIIEFLEERFPSELWHVYTSASEPVIFASFIVEHIRVSELVLRALRELESVEPNAARVIYLQRDFPGIRYETMMHLFNQAGIEPPTDLMYFA